MEARKFRINCSILPHSSTWRVSYLQHSLRWSRNVLWCLCVFLNSSPKVFVEYTGLATMYWFPMASIILLSLVTVAGKKTFETMWWILLLAVSRLKCLKPNRACFLNNSEIMWCNLQMSELRTECYHLLRSKEAGLRDPGHVLPCDITFSFKELTQLLWVSKQVFLIFIYFIYLLILETVSHYVTLAGLELSMDTRLTWNS